MIICLVGDSRDLTLTYLGWLARQEGHDVLELDEHSLGVDWTFAFDLPDGTGCLQAGAANHAIQDIAGAVVRFHPQPGVAEELDVPPDLETILVAERRAAIEHFLCSAGFPVVNRPSNGRSNGSKPCQMMELTALGFAVPEWIASNDAAAVREVVSAWPEGAVYKSCSGLRSHVRTVDDQLAERLAAGTSPVVIQRYVPGRDVRVHVVDGEVFATEVTSPAVDYRFDAGPNEFRATAAPPEVGELSMAAAREAGLTLAGLDFRVTADGRWYCLEMNPVPTFLPYEMSTGQPIGAAVLRYIAREAAAAVPGS